MMFKPIIEHASAEMIVGLLDRFVGENKEAFYYPARISPVQEL